MKAQPFKIIALAAALVAGCGQAATDAPLEAVGTCRDAPADAPW